MRIWFCEKQIDQLTLRKLIVFSILKKKRNKSMKTRQNLNVWLLDAKTFERIHKIHMNF